MIEIIRENGIAKKILLDGVEQKNVIGYVFKEKADEINTIEITYMDQVKFKEE